jgi:hypothetical protein
MLFQVLEQVLGRRFFSRLCLSNSASNSGIFFLVSVKNNDSAIGS